ncbi:tetratricopeptide repeat protein [Ulvibacter sp. MAR_2010_11]|uniref:tetratricopeptide repeat protein n=1 Tax=Ulvibacter sp. MAR_2010_11 TaxID=1250229 RepID=UPI000C2C96D7|nr:tetratricopeptide repeat protein [Ulvibacter sp. MAR_2010_11]PKA82885.1 tetratricopeptide repeat protein [Ulvibacter sp. MAR_2010_11]
MLLPEPVYAQEIKPDGVEEPTDDLGNVSDAFQENFFEALKQKGIENYELAVDALKKAEKAAKGDSKQEAVIYFEMGKNLTYLKKYDEAEESFLKVLQTEVDRLDVLEALYDLYYQKRDYEAAIPLLEKLIKIDDDYKEDLANVYLRTKQYDKAIQMLDELDETWGESDYRDALRTQIYKETGNASGQIEKLEDKIDSKSKNEKDYLNLIFLYSDQGDSQKAYETAQELLTSFPKSELVHLALYKYYLEDSKLQEAINSMKKVFASTQVDSDSKYRVLGDFMQFVKSNPEFEKDLDEVVAIFSTENNGKVYEQLGDFYISKGMKEEALKFYEKGIVKDGDNFSLLKNTLLLQIDFKKYTEAVQLSSNGIEIFPSQPMLYLINGVANIGLQKWDDAIESMETGVDYLFEAPVMEKDFYEQLGIAYTQKGDTKRANDYIKKASEIKPPNHP